MWVRIHRGTQQIGGTCIEIEAEGMRLALDVGLPLDADANEDPKQYLPDVPGFLEPDDSLVALVISHPHMDHYGLAQFIRPDLPVMIGEAANDIINAAAVHIPAVGGFENIRPMKDRKAITIGPFTITPFLVDHSAFDAYSILIEAAGKRLFYTGDFRGHGRKAALFERLLHNPPRDIGVLLMEGTTIGRSQPAASFPTEQVLEQKFVDEFARTKGMSLVMSSAQNIDRIVTVYRAAKRSGRKLAMSLYAAEVLRATGRDSIPQGDWDDVRIFMPWIERMNVKEKQLFDSLPRYRKNRIYKEELKEASPKLVLLFQQSMRSDLDRAECLQGARLVYSMWNGYLKEDRMKPFLAWKEKHGLPMTEIHTSGHASLKDLQRLANALAPGKLVPIHSFETDRFPEFFDNVELKKDGQWWEV